MTLASSIVVALISLIHTAKIDAGLTCLACSYTFAGEDGSTDLQCVTDVYNFTRTFHVSCTHVCVTKTVYTRDYKRINSIARGCGFEEVNKCDLPDSVYPTCEVSCKSRDACNDQSGDLWSMMGDPGNGSPETSVSAVTWVLLHLAVLCKTMTSE
ncbi:uncharacterized protein LOC131951168 [Physella acuta]|uniref:uncharacterized protein LOC131951168 n=1 Tax=Physella acuta TaxID=109671 RepID=UPI0027DC8F77|nr:uncharacterized protein LOC131951168 [Physella acuta]XP_059169477.1 uncharacterized protein LOC131951168 [Physella acuta]